VSRLTGTNQQTNPLVVIQAVLEGGSSCWRALSAAVGVLSFSFFVCSADHTRGQALLSAKPRAQSSGRWAHCVF
jgi:hypothetical protein